MKKLLKIFGLLLLSTVLFLSGLYFYVGGYLLGGFTIYEIKSVSKECADELTEACHILLCLKMRRLLI